MRVVHVEEDALAAVGGVELSDVVERARGKEGGSGGSGGVGVESDKKESDLSLRNVLLCQCAMMYALKTSSVRRWGSV